MNVGTFAGRVGHDGELKTTAGGKSVLSFSIAIDRGKDSKGEDRAALWVKATVWEKRAESLAEHIQKGKFVIVSGPVDVETWTNDVGLPHAQIVITVREFTFGGK